MGGIPILSKKRVRGERKSAFLRFLNVYFLIFMQNDRKMNIFCRMWQNGFGSSIIIALKCGFAKKK